MKYTELSHKLLAEYANNKFHEQLFDFISYVFNYDALDSEINELAYKVLDNIDLEKFINDKKTQL